jgi:hypothetical protein
LVIAFAFAGLLWMRRRAASAAAGIDFDWVEEFSVAKYKPMERLLGSADFVFLARQPGYRPQMAARLRTERSRVFAAYLRHLTRDFDRLYAFAKQAVLHSPEGVDLCGALARHRAVFYYALIQVRVRLFLYRMGWAVVDVRPLIGALDEMMTDVRALRPAMQAI